MCPIHDSERSESTWGVNGQTEYVTARAIKVEA